MSTIELTSKVKELKELKMMAEELAAEITAIEDSIKAEMTARETEELITGEYKIRWKKVVSNRFDIEKLEEQLEDAKENIETLTDRVNDLESSVADAGYDY